MDFRSHIRNISKGKHILEIGPSYNPITPKSEGFQVTVMDHASEADLKVKYAAYGIDVSRIEAVDVVSTDLSELITAGRKFDVIIASHMIEHTTDIVQFIKNCESLIDNGLLALIVPDKRFCFDRFRPCSTAGQAIDAYLSQRNNHRGALFDLYANFVVNSDQMAWDAAAQVELSHRHGSEDASRALSNALACDEYVDAHEWVFTPTSFRLMMDDLRVAGLIKLHESFFNSTVGCEFLSIMSLNGKDLTVTRRSDLLDAIERENLAVNKVYASEIGALEKRLVEAQYELTVSSEAMKFYKDSLERVYESNSWKILGYLRALRSKIKFLN